MKTALLEDTVVIKAIHYSHYQDPIIRITLNPCKPPRYFALLLENVSRVISDECLS